MEFDSPDVAKEFPGLYYEDIDEGIGVGGKGKKSKSNHGSMNDPNDYDDDSDKSSKKKKDKKDSKKDKGYATLAGESSPDEDDRPGSKSPGRVKKLKAFKLTSSSKKHKDKEKEKDAPKGESASKAVAGGVSAPETSKKDKKHSLSSEKEMKKERKLSEVSKSGKSDKSLLDLVRKHSVPNSLSTSVSLAPPVAVERPSSTGRNRHPVPFSPTAAAASSSKEKEEKHGKKEIIDGVKVRLKLKRGSKNSLEETTVDHPTTATAPPPSHSQQIGRQLPEDPESIAKEIKKYEALLEQSHSQIQSSKKVSKKHEEQLWELQRTLTQLKRKLRSINALSCASISNTVLNPPPPTKHVESSSAPLQKATLEAQQPVPTILQPQKATVDPVQVNDSAEIVGIATAAHPDLIPESVEEISHAHANFNHGAAVSEGADPTTTVQVQVHAEVHNSGDSIRVAKYAITDDREYENITIGQDSHESFQEPQKGQSQTTAILEKKGSESSSSTIVSENMFESKDKPSKSSTMTSITATDAITHAPTQSNVQLTQQQKSVDADEMDDEFRHLHLTNNVDNRAKRNSLPSNQRLQRDHEVTEPGTSPPFNPLNLPLFQTDEFIALENEALIMFNQALQDQIIEEESEVEKLVKKLGGMIEDNNGFLIGVSIDDLEELDNDELVSMFETVKHENDVLHDQVNKLKSLVAKAKLEEFQLELRLKYLQEQEQELVEVPAMANAVA